MSCMSGLAFVQVNAYRHPKVLDDLMKPNETFILFFWKADQRMPEEVGDCLHGTDVYQQCDTRDFYAHA